MCPRVDLFCFIKFRANASFGNEHLVTILLFTTFAGVYYLSETLRMVKTADNYADFRIIASKSDLHAAGIQEVETLTPLQSDPYHHTDQSVPLVK